MLIARLGGPLLLAFLPSRRPLNLELIPDARVLLFAAGVCIANALTRVSPSACSNLRDRCCLVCSLSAAIASTTFFSSRAGFPSQRLKLMKVFSVDSPACSRVKAAEGNHCGIHRLEVGDERAAAPCPARPFRENVLRIAKRAVGLPRIAVERHSERATLCQRTDPKRDRDGTTPTLPAPGSYSQENKTPVLRARWGSRLAASLRAIALPAGTCQSCSQGRMLEYTTRHCRALFAAQLDRSV
jgi:hypothetical protein